MSFCPGLPEVVERVRPKGIAALEKNIPVFVAEMLERREQLRKIRAWALIRRTNEQEQARLVATVADTARIRRLFVAEMLIGDRREQLRALKSPPSLGGRGELMTEASMLIPASSNG